MTQTFNPALPSGLAAAVDRIADYAQQAKQPLTVTPIEDRNGKPGRLLQVARTDEHGEQHLEIVDLDTHGDGKPPEVRVRGEYDFDTIDALINYVTPFADEQSTAWVETLAGKITVVLDDHGADAPGRREHVASLRLKNSPEWTAWKGISDTSLPQVEFAQFLEDHITDIADPSGGALLELVTQFEATTTGEFKSKVRLDNGDIELVFTETTVEGSSGGAGTVRLPSQITLHLRRFLGEPAQVVTARLKYRKKGPALLFGIALDNVDEITEQTVEGISLKLAKAVPRTFAGSGARPF